MFGTKTAAVTHSREQTVWFDGFLADRNDVKDEKRTMKRLILVTSPPASGKTFISKQLAKNLKHVVYLDKDTLIVLSKQIFMVANQEYN